VQVCGRVSYRGGGREPAADTRRHLPTVQEQEDDTQRHDPRHQHARGHSKLLLLL
jgi:hypothetical protein